MIWNDWLVSSVDDEIFISIWMHQIKCVFNCLLYELLNMRRSGSRIRSYQSLLGSTHESSYSQIFLHKSRSNISKSIVDDEVVENIISCICDHLRTQFMQVQGEADLRGGCDQGDREVCQGLHWRKGFEEEERRSWTWLSHGWRRWVLWIKEKNIYFL